MDSHINKCLEKKLLFLGLYHTTAKRLGSRRQMEAKQRDAGGSYASNALVNENSYSCKKKKVTVKLRNQNGFLSKIMTRKKHSIDDRNGKSE